MIDRRVQAEYLSGLAMLNAIAKYHLLADQAAGLYRLARTNAMLKLDMIRLGRRADSALADAIGWASRGL